MMCTQVNNLFSCSHRAFSRFDNCPRFGKTCLGAGANHMDVPVNRVCNDCMFRASQADATPDAGGSPDSSGGAAGAGEKKADPWWDNDPWRKYRKA
jgi:hypothetical protein